MRHDKAFFEQIASISEITLMSAVAEMAIAKDFESLAVFIDFVKTTSMPLPIVNSNARLRIPHSDPATILGVHGVETHPQEAGMAQLLMKPLRHGLQTDDFDALPTTVLEPRQLAYLDLVVDLAGKMKERGVWRHAIFEAVARNTNDPAVLAHLPEQGYNVAAKTIATIKATSGGSSPGEATLASEALSNGNFALGVAMFRRMPFDQITGLDPKHPIQKTLCEHHVRLVARAMTKQPQAALDLLEVWGEKMPEHIGYMRASIFKHAVRDIPRPHKDVDPALLIEIIGTKPEDFEGFKNALSHTRTDGPQIASDIVGSHFVEALHLVKEFALIHEHDSRHTRRLGIHDAIGPSSLKIEDRAGEARLKATLQFLIDHGHDINNVIDDSESGALKVLATRGRKDDVTRKLHVLLALGADPTQKDSRNWVPSSHAGANMPQQKQAWLDVERSFKARSVSLGVLDEIEQEMAAPAAPPKSRP